MLLNELDRNISIYTDPRHKDFVYVNFFHCIMLCILEKYLYVILFCKFVLIIIIA